MKEFIILILLIVMTACSSHDDSDSTVVDYLMLVNKDHPLSKDFDPGENEVAKENLLKIIKEMKSLNMDVSDYYSGYRSYDCQKELYDDYVSKHGQKEADTFSARPGYSEHQTGLTFDLFHSDGQLLQYEKEAKWVSENAHRYGFIVRYKKEFESITGHIEEPWHIRYVGDAAFDIYEQGISLEQYLDKD